MVSRDIVWTPSASGEIGNDMWITGKVLDCAMIELGPGSSMYGNALPDSYSRFHRQGLFPDSASLAQKRADTRAMSVLKQPRPVCRVSFTNARRPEFSVAELSMLAGLVSRIPRSKQKNA